MVITIKQTLTKTHSNKFITYKNPFEQMHYLQKLVGNLDKCMRPLQHMFAKFYLTTRKYIFSKGIILNNDDSYNFPWLPCVSKHTVAKGSYMRYYGISEVNAYDVDDNFKKISDRSGIKIKSRSTSKLN